MTTLALLIAWGITTTTFILFLLILFELRHLLMGWVSRGRGQTIDRCPSCGGPTR